MQRWRSALRQARDRRRHPHVQFGVRLSSPETAADQSHPDVLRLTERAAPDGQPRIAVVVHVYYPDLLPGLLGPLGHIDEPFDLFVTNASGQPLEISSDHLSRMREVTVIPVRNLGRDIFPFMQLLAAGRLDSYELLLKLHTKKSAWRDEYVEKTRRGEVSAGLSGGGDEWRNGLVDGLVGSSDVVESVVFHFDDEPQLGLVVPSGNLLGRTSGVTTQTLLDSCAGAPGSRWIQSRSASRRARCTGAGYPLLGCFSDCNCRRRTFRRNGVRPMARRRMRSNESWDFW